MRPGRFRAFCDEILMAEIGPNASGGTENPLGKTETGTHKVTSRPTAPNQSVMATPTCQRRRNLHGFRIQSPVKNATTGFLNVNNTTGFGDYTAGSAQSFYAVVFDAATIGDVKNFIVSESVEKTFAANGSAQTWAFGNMGLTTSANKFANSSWQAVAVPEPTSGLLMLVGLAGLALRRRRA